MPFPNQEISSQDGKPLYLIRFVKQAREWTYTNVETGITFMGVVYSPLPIELTGFSFSGDAKSEGVDMTLPYNAALCQYLDSGAASSGVSIFIRKIHLTENPETGGFVAPVSLENAPMVWVGELVGIGRPAVNSRILRCNTLSLSMQRGGLRLTWSRNCPHMVYDSNCRVNKNLFAVPLPSVTVVDGAIIRASALGAHADGYFSGGFVEWAVDNVLVERRGIESHTGTDVTIIGGTRGMAGATGFKAYPGCPRVISICGSRFGNDANFGGVKYMQRKNPFTGGPVF